MRLHSLLVSAFVLAGLAAAQTPPAGGQQRDLKLEKIEPPKPPSNAPAQSYAVVVGVAAVDPAVHLPGDGGDDGQRDAVPPRLVEHQPRVFAGHCELP